MTSLRDQLRKCRHFNGLMNPTCAAGVRYDDVRVPVEGKPSLLPCFPEDGLTTCPQCSVFSEEEIDATIAEIEDGFREVSVARKAVVDHLGEWQKVCRAWRARHLVRCVRRRRCRSPVPGQMDIFTPAATHPDACSGWSRDVKTIIRYECEICHRHYHCADSAEACEKQGEPTPWPIGLLSAGTEGNDSFIYGKDHAFAVESTTVLPRSHTTFVSMWACRDTNYGDSLGKNTCGSQNGYWPVPFSEEWLTRPPMQRLIKWLRDYGVEPMVWVDGKAVRLLEVEK